MREPLRNMYWIFTKLRYCLMQSPCRRNGLPASQSLGRPTWFRVNYMDQDKNERDCRTSPISSFGTGNTSSLPSFPASWNPPQPAMTWDQVSERNRIKIPSKKVTRKNKQTKHCQRQSSWVSGGWYVNSPSLRLRVIRSVNAVLMPTLDIFLPFLFLSALLYWHRSEVAERELNFSINIIYWILHPYPEWVQSATLVFKYFEQLQRTVLVPVILHYDMLL